MADLIITERSNMVALANIARNKTGQTKELTFGEIFDTFENAEIAKNQDITITENGTYTPASGFTGFGSVKVEVESSGGGGGSTEEWIGDGNTHIWITLQEGRTSPMLGVCPNGTVTVDWGDGTTPDTLTGTSTSTVAWTPTHNYAEPGDYVITLTVDGEMGFSGSNSNNQYSCLLRYSSKADGRNRAYQKTVQKIELGSGVTSIGDYAFYNCHSLASIVIPDGVTSIGTCAFSNCSPLASIVIPDSVTSIGSSAFSYCSSLTSIVIPDGVTSINNGAFSYCYSLTSIVIPDGVTSIGNSVFSNCFSLSSIVIPDSVTSIGSYAFSSCYGIRYYDFTKHTTVPALANTNAFNAITSDCEIRVPAALYDEWIAATNWATYKSKIVAV
jgi:hypothetical protein